MKIEAFYFEVRFVLYLETDHRIVKKSMFLIFSNDISLSISPNLLLDEFKLLTLNQY